MPVIDVQALLTEAVVNYLTDRVGDSEEVINVHLCTDQEIEYCEEGEHFNVEMYWRLNLLMRKDDKGLCLTGRVPYDYCSDGDTKPMIALTERMWERSAFGMVMIDADLDKSMRAVIAEIEGGKSIE